jgi:hypothetical protein
MASAALRALPRVPSEDCWGRVFYNHDMYVWTTANPQSVFNVDTESQSMDDNINKLNETLTVMEDFIVTYLPAAKLAYVGDLMPKKRK